MIHFSVTYFSGPLLAAFFILSLQAPLLADQELRDNQSVKNGREALQSKVRYPWYDAKTDRIKRIDVKTADDADDKFRKSTRVYKSSNFQGINFPKLGPFFQSILRGLVWFLVIALFVALILAIIWAFLKYDDQKEAATTVSISTEETGTEVSSIENLPFQLQRPRSDLLSEARRHYEAENFGEAIVYLFSYQLVQLDKHQWIRLTRGKTNRQYLGETRVKPSLFGLVENTMLAFEDVFFGNYELSQERFEACWNRLDDFHQIVKETSS